MNMNAKPRTYDFASLGALLAPRSVAIIGASADPARIGGRPIAAMLSGFSQPFADISHNTLLLDGVDIALHQISQFTSKFGEN